MTSLNCSSLHAFLLSGTVLVCVACASPEPLPTQVRSTTDCDFRPTQASQQQMKKQRQSSGTTAIPESVSDGLHVNMLDQSISNKVQVHQIYEGSTQTGTTKVSALVVNCTDYPLWVQGRTHFHNPASFVGETSTWKSMHLAGRSQEIYSESSLSDEGARARLIELREGF